MLFKISVMVFLEVFLLFIKTGEMLFNQEIQFCAST